MLNDYGRIFLSSVDIAFAELKAGMENVQRTYTLNQNILSLGSNILHYLAIRLPRFSEAHPEIGIRQLDFTTLELVQKLLDRNILMYLLCTKIIRWRSAGSYPWDSSKRRRLSVIPSDFS